MTQEEKDYCEICGIHDSCAYASRGLQSKCDKTGNICRWF